MMRPHPSPFCAAPAGPPAMATSRSAPAPDAVTLTNFVSTVA